MSLCFSAMYRLQQRNRMKVSRHHGTAWVFSFNKLLICFILPFSYFRISSKHMVCLMAHTVFTQVKNSLMVSVRQDEDESKDLTTTWLLRIHTCDRLQRGVYFFHLRSYCLTFYSNFLKTNVNTRCRKWQIAGKRLIGCEITAV